MLRVWSLENGRLSGRPEVMRARTRYKPLMPNFFAQRRILWAAAAVLPRSVGPGTRHLRPPMLTQKLSKQSKVYGENKRTRGCSNRPSRVGAGQSTCNALRVKALNVWPRFQRLWKLCVGGCESCASLSARRREKTAETAGRGKWTTRLPSDCRCLRPLLNHF